MKKIKKLSSMLILLTLVLLNKNINAADFGITHQVSNYQSLKQAFETSSSCYDGANVWKHNIEINIDQSFEVDKPLTFKQQDRCNILIKGNNQKITFKNNQDYAWDFSLDNREAKLVVKDLELGGNVNKFTIFGAHDSTYDNLKIIGLNNQSNTPVIDLNYQTKITNSYFANNKIGDRFFREQSADNPFQFYNNVFYNNDSNFEYTSPGRKNKWLIHNTFVFNVNKEAQNEYVNESYRLGHFHNLAFNTQVKGNIIIYANAKNIDNEVARLKDENFIAYDQDAKSKYLETDLTSKMINNQKIYAIKPNQQHAAALLLDENKQLSMGYSNHGYEVDAFKQSRLDDAYYKYYGALNIKDDSHEVKESSLDVEELITLSKPYNDSVEKDYKVAINEAKKHQGSKLICTTQLNSLVECEVDDQKSNSRLATLKLKGLKAGQQTIQLKLIKDNNTIITKDILVKVVEKAKPTINSIENQIYDIEYDYQENDLVKEVKVNLKNLPEKLTELLTCDSFDSGVVECVEPIQKVNSDFVSLKLKVLKEGLTNIELTLLDQDQQVIEQSKQEFSVIVKRKVAPSINHINDLEYVIDHDYDAKQNILEKTLAMQLNNASDTFNESVSCLSSNQDVVNCKYDKYSIASLKTMLNFEILKEGQTTIELELFDKNSQVIPNSKISFNIKVVRLPNPELNQINISAKSLDLDIPYNQDSISKSVKLNYTHDYKYKNPTLKCLVNKQVLDCMQVSSANTARNLEYLIKGKKVGKHQVTFKLYADINESKQQLISEKRIEVNVSKKSNPKINASKVYNLSIAANKNDVSQSFKVDVSNLTNDTSEKLSCQSQHAKLKCSVSSIKNNVATITLKASAKLDSTIILSLMSFNKVYDQVKVKVSIKKQNPNALDTCTQNIKDKHHRIIKEVRCHKNKMIAQIFTYQYQGNSKKYKKIERKYYSANKKNRLVKTELYKDYMPNNHYRYKLVIFKFDNNKNKVAQRIETKRYNNKKHKQYLNIKYHSNGQRKSYELTKKNQKGYNTSKFRKLYFSNGRLKTSYQCLKYSKKAYTYRVITNYFKNGKKRHREYAYFNKKQQNTSKTQYRYNIKGKLKGGKGLRAWRIKIKYAKGKPIKTTIHDYNKRGKLVKR